MFFTVALVTDKQCKSRRASLIIDGAGVQLVVNHYESYYWPRIFIILGLYSQAIGIHIFEHFHGKRLGVDYGNYDDYCMHVWGYKLFL